MTWLLRLALMVLGHKAQLRVLREAKRYGVIAYMRLLQGSRRALIAALCAFLVVQLMLLSLLGAMVCAVLLWDADLQLKLEVLLAGFALLFTVPAIGLVYLFSERVWYRASGAAAMVEDVNKGA